ncbi:MAG: hypothetical protein ACRDOH_26750 [Streptosporangiaceae bacterium]
MADLIAIGYPDETTADAAAGEARRLATDLIIQPDAIAVIVRDGGTVRKTSLSKDDEKELQDALHGGQPAAQ